MSSPEPLISRMLRFLRATVMGGGATLTDFAIFMTCVRILEIAPASARLPALLAGASVQFFGSRHFVFRAATGSLSRQALLFIAFEGVSVALNWMQFQFLLPRFTRLPPELVSLLGSASVFLLFNYPTRRLIIFQLSEPLPIERQSRNPRDPRR